MCQIRGHHDQTEWPCSPLDGTPEKISNRKRNFLLLPSLVALRKRSINMACCLDRNGKLDEVPQDKKQKVATSLLCDKLHLDQSPYGPPRFQDRSVVFDLRTFCFTWNLRRVHPLQRAVHPLQRAVHDSKISHWGWWTNVSGWMSEWTRLSLSLITTNALSCTECFYIEKCYGTTTETIFSMTWSPRCSCEASSMESWSCSLTPLFFAHHQHRRSIENPGNFGDCMRGRIRFMTAITSAYAHAYESTCLTRHMPAVPRLNFVQPKPKAKYPHHNTRKRQGLSGMGHLHRRRCSPCWWWDLLLGGVPSLDLPMEEGI